MGSGWKVSRKELSRYQSLGPKEVDMLKAVRGVSPSSSASECLQSPACLSFPREDPSVSERTQS